MWVYWTHQESNATYVIYRPREVTYRGFIRHHGREYFVVEDRAIGREAGYNDYPGAALKAGGWVKTIV